MAEDIDRHGGDADPHRSAPWRVVVVDDNPLVGSTLVRVLCNDARFASAMCATDGDQARSLLAAGPHAALVDVNLDGESGLDLIAAWTVLYPATRFYAMSADGAGREAARSSGACGFFVKNTSIFALVETVASFLAGEGPELRG